MMQGHDVRTELCSFLNVEITPFEVFESAVNHNGDDGRHAKSFSDKCLRAGQRFRCREIECGISIVARSSNQIS